MGPVYKKFREDRNWALRRRAKEIPVWFGKLDLKSVAGPIVDMGELVQFFI